MSNQTVTGQHRLDEETSTPSEAVSARPRTLAQASLPEGQLLTLRSAEAADAPAMLQVIHEAFRARRVVGEQAEALSDTVADIARAIASGGGYVSEIDGAIAGCLLVSRVDGVVRLSRVSVVPGSRRLGVASFQVSVAGELLAAAGEPRVAILCRREYPELESWWAGHGFVRGRAEGNCWVMTRELPVVVSAPDADTMRALGARLAPLLRAGDVLIATGELGAGKTTFTQGLAQGLGVEGPVISPTFVLARLHRSRGAGPDLVHVDAYRLGGASELDDLDLDASLGSAVTVVEWGAGVAEQLNPDRLEIDIVRGLDPADDSRWVAVLPVGERWDRAALAAALTAQEDA